MPRTRAAEPPRQVTVQGRHPPVSRSAITRAAALVLRGERRQASLSITFAGPGSMRTLNRRWKGADRATDVLAFSLPGPGGAMAGDIYICPQVALREAARLGVTPREELLRMVVHGVLHVLGYDHPVGSDRLHSPMWRRQERYLRKILA